MICKHTYIRTLSFKQQADIKSRLIERGLDKEDIMLCMSQRLCDIEDIIYIEKYLDNNDEC